MISNNISSDSSKVDQPTNKPGKLFFICLAAFFLIIICAVIWESYEGSDLRIERISKDRSISDNVALKKMAEAAWTKYLKRVDVIQNAGHSYTLKVTIGYGSKLAFGSIHAERMRRTKILAEGALRMFRVGQKRNLDRLVLELETSIEPSGGGVTSIIAYRAELTLEQVKKIPQWEICTINDGAIDWVRKVWTVELDEFKHLQVR